MLRKMIERVAGSVSDTEFKAALAIATIDIRINRIGFGRRTSLKDVVDIAAMNVVAFRRCRFV